LKRYFILAKWFNDAMNAGWVSLGALLFDFVQQLMNNLVTGRLKFGSFPRFGSFSRRRLEGSNGSC